LIILLLVAIINDSFTTALLIFSKSFLQILFTAVVVGDPADITITPG